MPTPGSLFGSILFGAIGMAAFVQGKRVGSIKTILIAILLMAFPYFVSEAWLVFLLGAGLTAALFVFRD